MKGIKWWAMAILLALVLIPGAASAVGIEMSLGVWNQDPKGDISFKAQSVQDNLSIRDNLGYGDSARVFGRVKIDTPLLFPNVYLMATPMAFKGTGNKDVAFQFGDVTFNGNVPFTSELKLDHYDVGFYYGIPGINLATTGILNVELGLGARIVDFKARITGQLPRPNQLSSRCRCSTSESRSNRSIGWRSKAKQGG
jgi:outer membrane protein